MKRYLLIALALTVLFAAVPFPSVGAVGAAAIMHQASHNNQRQVAPKPGGRRLQIEYRYFEVDGRRLIRMVDREFGQVCYADLNQRLSRTRKLVEHHDVDWKCSAYRILKE